MKGSLFEDNYELKYTKYSKKYNAFDKNLLIGAMKKSFIITANITEKNSESKIKQAEIIILKNYLPLFLEDTIFFLHQNFL